MVFQNFCCHVSRKANPIVSQCSDPLKTTVLWSFHEEQPSEVNVDNLLSSPYSKRFQGTSLFGDSLVFAIVISSPYFPQKARFFYRVFFWTKVLYFKKAVIGIIFPSRIKYVSAFVFIVNTIRDDDHFEKANKT